MLSSWERPHLGESGQNAFLFYVAFGAVDWSEPLSSSRYRCAGVPECVQMMAYDRAAQPEGVERYLEGYAWETLCAEDPALAAEVDGAPGCMVLRAECSNPETLDYLRDSIGLLTYMLDHGARAIYDPQAIRWWSPAEWRERVFEPGGPVPREHAVILQSNDAGRLWMHTRGMRKFGRPDISVRGVGRESEDAVAEMISRFIDFQALGAVVPEGQVVRLPTLPVGGVVRHRGYLDDPDFNNLHFEVEWPAPLP